LVNSLKYVKEFRNDRAFVLELVSQNGLILQHFHQNMKKDRDVFKVAIQQNKEAIRTHQQNYKKMQN